MAFKLNLNNIDTNYPVPGIDNPSQGFRDNFNIIENNFIELDDVVGTLDDVAVRVNTVNDFNGQGTLENVTVRKIRESVNLNWDTGTDAETSIECNWDEANLYVVKVSFIDIFTPLTINLNNWPNAGYAKMNLLLTKESVENREILWAAKEGSAVIKKLGFPESFVLEINDPVLIEAFTYNGAGTVFLRYVGKFV